MWCVDEKTSSPRTGVTQNSIKPYAISITSANAGTTPRQMGQFLRSLDTAWPGVRKNLIGIIWGVYRDYILREAFLPPGGQVFLQGFDIAAGGSPPESLRVAPITYLQLSTSYPVFSR